MKTRKFRLALSCATLLLAASVQSYAGGPLALRDAGAPYLRPERHSLRRGRCYLRVALRAGVGRARLRQPRVGRYDQRRHPRRRRLHERRGGRLPGRHSHLSGRANTRAKAKRVDLPFDSSNRLLYTEIEPVGSDVDYFKFSGKAGQIFVAETVPGLPDMDTVIGLFNSSGTLIAADDDGGAGLLSRLAVTLPANGDYLVAVSTFPDVTFTGAGEDFGRYVLTMNIYTGTLLPLVDDESVQVPLNTFTFPYRGVNRTSVFVNANGNLTFGAANGDFSETVPEFLGGPPRIAPLWDDLFPGDGLVIAEEKNKSLYVHFVTVPELFGDSPNYFTVVLDKKDDITMDYGATSRSDVIVGVTKGGGAADPGPRNLSSASHLSAVGTTYEQFFGSTFGYGGVDLSFQQLKFKK